MCRHLFTATFGFFVLSCSPGPQTTDAKAAKPLPISSYFPEQKAQVLVVGSFHFDYPGLDAMKTADEDQIDVLEEPRRSEVEALARYLEGFRPGKIAIEAMPGWEATRKLREYREGQHRDKRDERYQLGMRLADRLGLDTLYAVDAGSVLDTLQQLTPEFIAALGKDYDFQSEDPFDLQYRKWFEGESKVLAQHTLLDYFRYMNSPESHQYGYGAYLIGDFNLGETRGADMLALYWYNRNLRIFRNLQRITESPEDRILLLVGNGHAAVLRQLLEASPEFEFVEFDSLPTP